MKTTTNLRFKVPKGWRKGQTIFNFLAWLKTEKLFSSEFVDMDEKGQPKYAQTRMADSFHIDDEQLEGLYDEFLLLHDGTNN